MNNGNTYTVYVVANTLNNSCLTEPAYSLTSASFDKIEKAYTFHDPKKARSCASNINRRGGKLTSGKLAVVVPVTMKRRNAR